MSKKAVPIILKGGITKVRGRKEIDCFSRQGLWLVLLFSISGSWSVQHNGKSFNPLQSGRRKITVLQLKCPTSVNDNVCNVSNPSAWTQKSLGRGAGGREGSVWLAGWDPSKCASGAWRGNEVWESMPTLPLPPVALLYPPHKTLLSVPHFNLFALEDPLYSSPSNSGTPFKPRSSSLFSINCDFLLPEKWSPLLSYRNCHLPKRATIQPACMLTLWFVEDQPLLQQFCEGRPVEGDCSFVSQPHRPILSHRDYINNSTVWPIT